jgi:signal transduction histidine kinase
MTGIVMSTKSNIKTLFRHSDGDQNSNESFCENIVDNIPAEISVIEMAEGPDKFDLVYVNKTKANEFGHTLEEVRGKKCFEVFEPYRSTTKREMGHCKNCPSYQAFINTGKHVRAEWPFSHPLRMEERIASITSKRIPGTTKVIEIVRDSTIRTRVFESIIELSRAKSLHDIEEIFYRCFLQLIYFDRCRFYGVTKNSENFYLRGFKASKPNDENRFKRDIVDIHLDKNVILNAKNSKPDSYILNNLFSEPRLYYIIEFTDSRLQESKYIKPVHLHECYLVDELEKKNYPVWVDLPLVSSGQVLGKISVDIKPREDTEIDWLFQEYDIQLLGIFVRSIAQAMENVKLLDINELKRIDEIMLKSDGKDFNGILYQILKAGCKYLDIDFGLLEVLDENNTLKIINPFDGNDKVEEIEFENSLLYYIKTHLQTKENYPVEMNVDDHIKIYKKNQDIPDISEQNVCLIHPIFDKHEDIRGVFYFEGKDQIYSEQKKQRMKLISDSTSIALNNLYQYKQLEEKTRQANRHKEEAIKNLKEKESFFETAEHEMIAPIEPIMRTFELLKRRLGHAIGGDKKLGELLDAGRLHCEFLRYVFDNFDFLRSDTISLNLDYKKIFSNVIIPVIEIVREYAKRNNILVEYVGYTNVEKYIMLDETYMKHVFFNLLRNAIRYSNKGAKIYIRGVGVKDGTSIIDIENMGIGIQEDWKERIFELHQRAGNAKKHSSEGSGIGLYIARRIVETHHGKIYVKQNHNPTIFRIELPKNVGREE